MRQTIEHYKQLVSKLDRDDFDIWGTDFYNEVKKRFKVQESVKLPVDIK